MAEEKCIQRFASLETMSTEQLERILRADLETQDYTNEELILKVLEILERRELEQPTGKLVDVEKVWTDFQKNYNTEEGSGLSLYPFETEREQGMQYTPKRGRGKPLGRWLVLAAVIVCVLLVMVPPALGYESVFSVIGRWTDNLFYFAQKGNVGTSDAEYVFQTDNEGLQKLYDTVLQCGIEKPVVPMWLPEGFSLVTIDVKDTQNSGKSICALFSNGEDTVSINIRGPGLGSDSTGYYEKNADNVIQYHINNIVHYIIKNTDYYAAVWRNGNIEACIDCVMEKDELYKIIDSIYK